MDHKILYIALGVVFLLLIIGLYFLLKHHIVQSHIPEPTSSPQPVPTTSPQPKPVPPQPNPTTSPQPKPIPPQPMPPYPRPPIPAPPPAPEKNRNLELDKVDLFLGYTTGITYITYSDPPLVDKNSGFFTYFDKPSVDRYLTSLYTYLKANATSGSFVLYDQDFLDKWWNLSFESIVKMPKQWLYERDVATSELYFPDLAKDNNLNYDYLLNIYTSIMGYTIKYMLQNKIPFYGDYYLEAQINIPAKFPEIMQHYCITSMTDENCYTLSDLWTYFVEGQNTAKDYMNKYHILYPYQFLTFQKFMNSGPPPTIPDRTYPLSNAYQEYIYILKQDQYPLSYMSRLCASISCIKY